MLFKCKDEGTREAHGNWDPPDPATCFEPSGW